MGLDMVDIVIGTENVFGISIPDEDAIKLVTVGQYFDYVVKKLSWSQYGKCQSSEIFYRLRRAFGDRLGIQRHEFMLDTNLDDLLPSQYRKEVWSDIAKASDLVFPSLIRPKWVGSIMVAGTAGFVLAALLFHSWLFTIGIIAFPVATYYLTTPLATRIPQDTLTVRSTVKHLLQTNIGKPGEREQAWDADKVWTVLVDIIVDRLKIDRQLVTREARFVHDLGAG